MAARNPSQRSQIASIAAHQRWALTSDRIAATAPARLAFADRFTRLVDPENLLDPAERDCRAQHARTAYMRRLALASAKARAKRRPTTATSDIVDAVA